MTWDIWTIKLFVVKGHEKTSDACNYTLLSFANFSIHFPLILNTPKIIKRFKCSNNSKTVCKLFNLLCFWQVNTHLFTAAAHFLFYAHLKLRSVRPPKCFQTFARTSSCFKRFKLFDQARTAVITANQTREPIWIEAQITVNITDRQKVPQKRSDYAWNWPKLNSNVAFPAVKSVPHVRNVQDDNESKNFYKRSASYFPGAQLIRCLAITRTKKMCDHFWNAADHGGIKVLSSLESRSVEIRSEVSEVGSRILAGGGEMK